MQQLIFRGTVPDDGTGDTPYVEAGKTNDNFLEVYGHLGNRNNPHGTTPSQIGTYSAEEIDQRLGSVTETVAKGLLTAMSVTPATLIAATQVALEIIGEQRPIFAPGPFAVISRVSTAADYAVVRSITYDRTTGIYTFEVVTVGGNPGPHDDWIIAAVAGSTLAQMQLLAQGQATSDVVAQAEAVVVAARDLVVAARDVAEDARDQAVASQAAAETAGDNTLAAAIVADDAANAASANAAAALASAQLAQASASAAAASASSVDTTTFLDLLGTRAMTGEQTLVAAGAGRASAVLPAGSDPTAPKTGALWSIGSALKFRLATSVSAVVAWTNLAQAFTALQTFLAGLVLSPMGADPTSPEEGRIWARTGLGFFGRMGGATLRLLDGGMFATTAQAQAGTATDVPMSPARTAEAIQALATTNVPGTSAKLAADFSTTSQNFVDTGLSATITPGKAAGRVEIVAIFQISATNGQGTTQSWRLLRGSTIVGEQIFYQADNSGTPRTCFVVQQEVPGAGPQTYTLYAKTSSVAVAAVVLAGASITLKDLGA